MESKWSRARSQRCAVVGRLAINEQHQPSGQVWLGNYHSHESVSVNLTETTQGVTIATRWWLLLAIICPRYKMEYPLLSVSLSIQPASSSSSWYVQPRPSSNVHSSGKSHSGLNTCTVKPQVWNNLYWGHETFYSAPCVEALSPPRCISLNHDRHETSL